MRHIKEDVDIVVVGGGLAGTSAAVAAARLGSRVALVTNRPVLGGNSSSEIRVWVVGATAHGTQRFARETGIMGELFLENQFRNPQGNPYYWDQTVLDLVRAEPNISLHLNTDVRTLDMEGEGVIRSVTGWTMGSEIETELSAPVFLDCTGDGLVGHLAGAQYRVGRESQDEYGETWAPEQADRELLGSSLFFYTHDTGAPEKFVPPNIAKDISKTPIPRNRIIRTGDNGCNYWWIEWGGEVDTVDENERIRDELWSVVYGIWDHIKNSGDFDADTLTLEWVGAIPGKREYRRFLGDYVLTQQDILQQRSFPDAVAFGGWSIDLHPVEGVYAEKPGAQQRYSNGTYAIPYRSLYSRNVDNLLFAGRNISASHIAFGSTRVMATCSTLGQAAGTAAHLSAHLGTTPRALGQDHLPELLRTLHREDAPVIGLHATDDEDLARSATITASSELTTIDTVPSASSDRFPLDRDVALVVPVDPALESITLRATAEAPASTTVELWDTGKPQNYVPVARIAATQVEVPVGEGEVTARFDWAPETPRNAVLVVSATPGVALHLTDGNPYGLLALTRKQAWDAQFDHQIPSEEGELVTQWEARPLRGRSFAGRIAPDTNAYRAAAVADGYQRPYGGPHLWSSEAVFAPAGQTDRASDVALDAMAAPSLTLRWDAPVRIGSVRIVLNDDVDTDLINLHHHRTKDEVMPTLVRDYRLEGSVDGEWRELAGVRDNRIRHRIHDVSAGEYDALRLVVEGTNGSPYAMVQAIKVYANPSARTTLP
ncbi:FAD-dependent oxidoreductase [Brachybacterium sacelli]|uniref:Pyridine nucleotide-disulfide oxidoreductase n=1 Tax=Brachybacterium sacelli TaxID=173364 RepID=A0ABS4WYW5_9MICO|nr:FAD-dependent oxidoreductase [Brachybacterium sacelli]MBP2381333.1 hypothetical protein [Brachybacterium sacelli]